MANQTIEYCTHTLKLLRETNGNWDYYIDPTDDTVFYIAKVDDCKSGYFGTLEYFNKMDRRHSL